MTSVGFGSSGRPEKLRRGATDFGSVKRVRVHSSGGALSRPPPLPSPVGLRDASSGPLGTEENQGRAKIFEFFFLFITWAIKLNENIDGAGPQGGCLYRFGSAPSWP